MSVSAMLFMSITWAGVLGLVGFCFVRVLRGGGGWQRTDERRGAKEARRR